MTRANDLAPLLRASPADIEFRQGTIISWDSATGTNAVDVQGVTLTNLPCLNIGDFVILNPGDVVGIHKVKSAYFILGRIQLPGPPDESRAVVDFEIQDESNISFAQQTTYGTKVTVTVPVPSWIRDDDEIAIGATFVCTSRNQGASTPSDPSILQARIHFEYGGNTFDGQTTVVDVGLNRRGQVTAVGALNVPAWSSITSTDTITVQGQTLIVGGTNWSTDTAAVAALMTTSVFRRTQ